MAPLLILRVGAVVVLGVSLYCITDGARRISDKSYTKSRDQLIAKYKDAIGLWTQRYRPDFATIESCNLTLNNSVAAVTVRLTKSESADYLEGKTPDDLPRYTPLRYTYSGDIKWNKTDRDQDTALATFDCGSFHASYPMQLAKTTVIGGVVAKVCRFQYRGQFVDQNGSRPMQCLVYSELDSFCFVVAQELNGTFVSNVGPNGPEACRGSNAESTRVVTSEDYDDTGIGPVEITIRSRDDPWIVASHLTSGTFSFGLTSKQYLSTAIITLVFGIFGVGISGLMMWCACGRMRRRPEENVEFTDMHSVPRELDQMDMQKSPI